LTAQLPNPILQVSADKISYNFPINKRDVDMSTAPDQNLLEVLLDSWDRNNTILVNLLRAIPEGGLEIRAMEGSPSIAQMFAHMHYVRLVFLSEDAPEFAKDLPKKVLPEKEWADERDRTRMAQMLNDSAQAVREAVKSKVQAGQEMNLHFDHPILLLQYMIWHDGYHQGQIKLALKLAGRPITNKEAGPLTWRVWMNKK
jgi:uncharacterized damage-inducible protein DinB